MTKTVIGIDPGSINCGWAILQYEDGKVVQDSLKSGIVQAKASSPLNDRLVFIFQNLQTVMDDYTDPMDAMVVEKYFVKAGKGATVVSETRGILRLLAGNFKLEYQELTPSSIKKRVSGNGRADKEEVRKAVKKLLTGVPKVSKADEYDAIAIALSFTP